MGLIYLTDLATWLRDAGLNVIEYSGWQERSRGSGGYDQLPLCVMWHHTASGPSWNGQKDADYIATGDEDAPLANLYIDRSGTVWVIAAGATNTNGSGNSITFSRGTVPQDSMNTRALGVEMGNDGVGELWPRVQVDSMFMVSNVCNANFGNQPTDVSTHNFYAPTRKIDPATINVEGSWKPASANSSSSWHVESVRDECLNRWGSFGPTPEEDDEMLFDGFWCRDNDPNTVFVIFTDGTKKWVGNEGDLVSTRNLYAIRGCTDEVKLSVRVQPDPTLFTAFGVVVGPLPNDGVNRDEWGNIC
jgi:N-acetylmuramoyl-L-alanine amidase